MKKIVIALALLCATVVASAATYNWQVTADWVSADGENPLVGTVYAFDANQYSYSTVMAALATSDAELANAMGSAAITDEGVRVSGSGLTDNGGSPLSASVFAVIIASDGTDNYAYGLGTRTVEITDAVAADQARFFFGDDVETGAIGGAGWSKIGGGGGDVPEPTSGLLLLLGVAGLALRRRRA